MEKINDLTNLINLEDFDIIINKNQIIFRIRYNDNKYFSVFNFKNLKEKYYFFRNCQGVEDIMDKFVKLKNNKYSCYKIYEKDDDIHLKIENEVFKINQIEIFEIIFKKYGGNSLYDPELIGLILINEINFIKGEINNIDKKVKLINPWKIKILFEKKIQQIDDISIKFSKIKKHFFNLYENLFYFNFKIIHSFKPYNDNSTINSIKFFPNGNYITNDFAGNIKIWNEKNELIEEIINKLPNECGTIIIKKNNCFIQIYSEINEYIQNKKTNKWELQPINNIFLNKKLILRNIIFCKNKFICYFKNNLSLILIYETLLNGSYQLINSIELPFEVNESIGGIIFINESLTLIIATSKSVYLLNYITFEIKKKYINSVRCYIENGICKLDENRIIFHNGNKNEIKIINITTDEFKEIKILNICWSISLFKERNMFLCGLNNGKIQAFKSNDYTLCCTVDLKLNFIKGFFQLVNQKDVIGCYSDLFICFIKYEKEKKNDTHQLY